MAPNALEQLVSLSHHITNENILVKVECLDVSKTFSTDAIPSLFLKKCARILVKSFHKLDQGICLSGGSRIFTRF